MEIVERAREARALDRGRATSAIWPRRSSRRARASVSALTGEGIADSRARIIEALSPRGRRASRKADSSPACGTSSLLRESLEALDNARRAAEFGIPHEMLLLDLYAALRPIDAITGATTADDILNRIFSTFCIGK